MTAAAMLQTLSSKPEYLVVAAGNALLLANALFGFSSLFMMLLIWGSILAIGYGAYAKLTGKLPSDSELKLEAVVTKENVSEVASVVYDKIECALSAVAPIVFWQEPINSFGAMVALYFIDKVFGFLDIGFGNTGFLFLLFNGIVAYCVFGNEIKELSAPYVGRAQKQLSALIAKIPKYQPEAGAAVASKKQGKAL